MHIIKEIFLDQNFTNYTVASENAEKKIGPLGKINIFVGENNSGKSRFLRQLAKSPTLQFKPNDDSLAKLKEIISKLKKDLPQVMEGNDANNIHYHALQLTCPD